ncbi:MAG: hypothetical protein JWM59_2680 [Verrucomicrobiales bacterium]|nr:hypothetical protein [Verrucomicrobiales bacterium]
MRVTAIWWLSASFCRVRRAVSWCCPGPAPGTIAGGSAGIGLLHAAVSSADDVIRLRGVDAGGSAVRRVVAWTEAGGGGGGGPGRMGYGPQTLPGCRPFFHGCSCRRHRAATTGSFGADGENRCRGVLGWWIHRRELVARPVVESTPETLKGSSRIQFPDSVPVPLYKPAEGPFPQPFDVWDRIQSGV